ncbi:MAG TPA: hypothetical protein PLR37_04105 [Candidatus Accumulibacter phosphatis]|nr:hypothetical protein [Candidatus Accumulibacter phosphatis]
MADNLTTNPGAGGADIATDEIGGIHYPISKIAVGALDTATLVSSADPLPVGGAFVKAEDSAGAPGDYGIVILAQRRDTDTTAVDADGDYATLTSDETGRLKVSAQPASYALVSGNITASGQNVSCDVSRCSNVVLMMNTSSLSGHNCTFEGSLDSTNGTDGVWFTVQALRSNSNTVETTLGGAMSATPPYSWELSVNACNYFRVRATAHTSGTATWKIQRGTYATEPIPAAQVSSTQGITGNVGTTPVTPSASTINSAATTNATSIKASAGSVYGIVISNTGGAARYVKLYNKASAPTVGTDVPVLTIKVATDDIVSIDVGTQGLRFTTGIALAITANAVDTDTTAIGASEVKVLMAYI